MNYLYYFLANCDRKNQISELVGYLTTACKQALLRNCSRRLRAVATFRELSMTSNFGCFALLRVQSKRTLKQVYALLYAVKQAFYDVIASKKKVRLVAI